MSIISISKISHSFGDEEIFHNINFSAERNTKLGLVGKNGCGKTTLLNIITSKLQPDIGNIHKAKKAKIAYLTQEPELDNSITLQECVLASRKDFTKALQKLRKAEIDLSNDDISLKKFSNIQQDFELMGGYHFRTEMKLVLTSLQFPKSVWNQKIRLFSGGEQTRIQLATILLQPFDLLLLDEPTNHLDIEMIFWLEKYLANLDKPYIIISHDRYFLDNTITKIAEIKNYDLDLYSGNYSFYKEERKAKMELLQKTAKRQYNKVKKGEKQLEQYRIWGRARDSEKMFKRAKELEKRLNKMEQIKIPKKEKKISLNFKTEKRSGNDVYTFENMSFGFPENTLAENINLRIFYKDKIAILGKNGCGKTTFLKLINKKFLPKNGIAKMGASLDIGYYDQMHLNLNDSLTVMESIWQLRPRAPREYVFSYLAKYGFLGDDVDKKVAILSGGEKARLYLAILIHEKPNFLILDEPTNHLDINMISYLEAALLEFEGTIVFVSHDRYFIDKIATRKWMFQNGTIEEVVDNLDNLFFQKSAKIVSEKNRNIRQKKTNPLILEKLNNNIEKDTKQLENKQLELIKLELEFSNPKMYNDSNLVKTLTNNIQKIKDEIEKSQKILGELEEKYLQLLE